MSQPDVPEARRVPTPGDASPQPVGTVGTVGTWPEPAHMGSVVVAGLVWAAWIGFMVWMMLARIQASSSV